MINQVVIIMLGSKRKVKVKQIEGTPYLIAEEQFIGKGNFGEVYRAYNRQNLSEELVAKVIPLDEQIFKYQSVKAQLQVLRNLPEHKNLVNCKKLEITSKHNFYIIMEYCNQGSFQSFLKSKSKQVSQDKIWDFLNQICKGYQILYDNKIIHRDIKPDNILIHNGIMKICDFGLARKIDHNMIAQKLSVKGTPLYMAPELKFKEEGDSKIDVFSLGVVVYRLAFKGQFPFGTNFRNTSEYFDALESVQVKIPKFPAYSDELKKLILLMLQKDSEKRIGWLQIFDNPKIRINKVCYEMNFSEEVKMADSFASSLQIMKTSIANVKCFPKPVSIRQLIVNETQMLLQFQHLIISRKVSKIQEWLYKGKVLCLVIQHVNNRIKIEMERNHFHENIQNRLTNCLRLSFKFGLEILTQMKRQINTFLETISSNGEKQPSEQSKNILQSINIDYHRFQASLKLMNEEVLTDLLSNASTEYCQHLYNFLTQFIDFPYQLRENLKVIVSFLTDIYDASLKFVQPQECADESTQMDAIKLNNSKQLNEYMLAKENITLDDVDEKMKKIGLLFI